MRLKPNVVILLIALALTSLSFAQTGNGRQRGQRRNNPAISSLVFRTDVQTDLALTDEEKAKLDAIRGSLRGQFTPGVRQTPEERAAQEEESGKKVEELLTPDQVKRIHEIQIQVLGSMALQRKSVQEGLGLSSDQVSKLTDLFKKYQEANQSIRQKQQSGEIDGPTAGADRQKNLAALKAEADKVLTADQTSKFEAMGGKHFESAAPVGIS